MSEGGKKKRIWPELKNEVTERFEHLLYAIQRIQISTRDAKDKGSNTYCMPFKEYK